MQRQNLQTSYLQKSCRDQQRSCKKYLCICCKGAQTNTTNAGIFDLDTDSNGRWSVEKFKGLMFAVERDANAIGQQTRRGKGNMIICSADVPSALQMGSRLHTCPK